VINTLVLRPPLVDQEIRPGDFWSYRLPQAGYLVEDTSNKAEKVDLLVAISSTLIQVNAATSALITSRAVTIEDAG
jgi:hypothetical protein